MAGVPTRRRRRRRAPYAHGIGAPRVDLRARCRTPSRLIAGMKLFGRGAAGQGGTRDAVFCISCAHFCVVSAKSPWATSAIRRCCPGAKSLSLVVTLPQHAWLMLRQWHTRVSALCRPHGHLAGQMREKRPCWQQRACGAVPGFATLRACVPLGCSLPSRADRPRRWRGCPS